MVFKIPKLRASAIKAPKHTIIYHKLFITSYIAIYENNNINVEKSSWSPLTCFETPYTP